LAVTGLPVFSRDSRRLFFLDEGVIYVWGVRSE
jgi:hypothetical protein